MDKKQGIGKDNKLLWHIPEDLKRFKKLTSGHPIIMGRKTFESIGRPLPNRTNIIITRDASYRKEGTIVVHSLNEAIKIAHSSCNPELDSGSHFGSRSRNKFGMTKKQVRHDNCEVFVIGGGQIFVQALPFADKLYLTIVEKEFDADTFFPDYSEFKKVLFKQKRRSGEYTYRFLDLEKQ